MTPAGTSNELDVQNEWEENTYTPVLITFPELMSRLQLAAAQPRMSNDTWEEVVSSSLTTQSLPESHSDDGSKQPEQSTAPSLIISGANFDEDVDGTGSFQQARGAFILMFIILVWLFAVRYEKLSNKVV